MKIALSAAIFTLLTFFAFPTLSLASVVEPIGAFGHVFENTDVDYGMRAGVQGEVKVIDRRSLLVQGDGLIKSQTLVVATDKKGLTGDMVKALTSHNEVRVEGRVQILSLEKLEERTGIKLDTETLRKYEGKTVVVAETIDLK